MRIRQFSWYLKSKELEPLEIRNTTVVVDGTRFFYHYYAQSGLMGEFGYECDRYAAFLRGRLTMFKRANITCYFLFKGANDYDQFIDKVTSTEPDYCKKIPILAKHIVREVLKEMDFKYVACENESKKETIALAKKLKCPIISLDIEMCFSRVKYIPLNTIKFNESDNTITCSYFFLDNFLGRNNLTEEKLALFIVLTDENIYPQNHFSSFFEHLNPGSLVIKDLFPRYSSLLKWLSSNNRKTILKKLNKFISVEDRERFLEEETKVLQFMKRQESYGHGAASLLNQSDVPDWFAKGVAEEHISKTYVNLYRDHQYYGVCSNNATEEDGKLLTLEIVKYAYDLLTNFNNDGFQLLYGRIQHMHVDQSYSIKKPECSADKCVFENGWGSVRSLELLEHFLRETLSLELRSLERLPVNARLLVAALVYFTWKKPTNTSAEARCVLLSYVTLSLVFPKTHDLPTFPSAIDLSTDEDPVTMADCITAAKIMIGYHTIAESDVEGILVRNLLRPLEEFQYCLLALMDLNALCGAPLVPPTLHRSFNGTLVYRLRHAMSGESDTTQFLDKLLSPAPTVYAFFNRLVEVYEEIVNRI